MILESGKQGKRYENCSISFLYNGENIEFSSNNTKSLFKDVIDWLYKSGYSFSGDLHKIENTSRRIFSEKEVDDIVSKTSYEKRMFHKIADSDKYILCNSGVNQLFGDLVKMIVSFGIDSKTIKTEGLFGATLKIPSPSKIKPFSDFEGEGDFDPELEPIELEPIKKSKIFKPNPFRQSICVLGESGAGKSVTIETILENEGHNFEFIIPTAATTGLLAQFSPSKSGYVPSRLGKMLMEASKNHQQLYTAVFDEMHKSNVIEMINDELLQAISTKRNRGRRFISLDDDTAEIYQGSELDTERGNLLIPDNFGFIFISSKPRVIANNADFFNRVDIAILKSYEEETIETSEQLLANKLSDEEKMKLASTRND